MLRGLGLTVLALGVGLSPAAAAVPTLTGENLSGSSSQGNSGGCPTTTFSVTGTATDPYEGTFSETGSSIISPGIFSAAFTITSGTTTVTGSKEATAFVTPGLGGDFVCTRGAGAAGLTGVPYTAMVHTLNGNFHDEGVSAVRMSVTQAGTATLTESFTSSLVQPVLIGPTNKNQCKNNRWKNFPQFKNQGQCVSSVVSQSQP